MSTMDTCKDTSLTSKHGDWLRHAYYQLATVLMSNRDLTSLPCNSDRIPVYDTTVMEAQKLLLEIFRSVRTAPPPIIVADPFDGDLSIIWKDDSKRVEAVIHNDGSGIASFVSDSGTTKPITMIEIQQTLLTLAA